MQRVERWQDIRPGDIGFLRGEGFLSDSIAHLTARRDLMGLQTPSHSLLVLSRTQVIEALEKTKVRPIEVYRTRFDAGDLVVFAPDVPKEIRREALHYIWTRYNHAAYGWGQILAFLPVLFWRRLRGRDPVNLLPLGVICSELVLLYLRRCFDRLLAAGHSTRADRLAWAYRLSRNTTDPALQLSCCLRDGLPESLAG
ncbi:MAG: hypothetical protein ACOYXN_00470 [Acidobacteriota bacterium]